MGTLPYPDPQMAFRAQYEAVRRDEVVGVLLALFLGSFGIHHFYLGRVGWGIVYCLFSWTGIPAILSLIECFFMPGRVREYNAMQAAEIAAALGIAVPGWVGYPGWVAPGWAAPTYGAEPGAPVDATTLAACPNCGRVNAPGARFCANCGSRIG